MLKLQTIFGFSYLSPPGSGRNLGFSILIQIKNNLKIFIKRGYITRVNDFQWIILIDSREWGPTFNFGSILVVT